MICKYLSLATLFLLSTIIFARAQDLTGYKILYKGKEISAGQLDSLKKGTIFISIRKNDSKKELTVKSNPNLIYWSENTKLIWKDFSGNPPPPPSFTSLTYTGIFAPRPQISGDTLTLSVRATFDRSRSWVLDISGRPPQLLEHEQLHFDIAELLSRRIKKAILEKEPFKNKTAEEEIKKIIKQESSKYVLDQTRYDRETGNSMIQGMQIEWANKVAHEMESLNNLRGHELKVLLAD